MKKLKKIVSFLLVGVIAVTSLFCGTVSAGAEDKKFSDPYFSITLTKKGYFIVEVCYDENLQNYYHTLLNNKTSSDAVLFVELNVAGYAFGVLETSMNNMYTYIRDNKTSNNISIDEYTTQSYSQKINNNNYISRSFWIKKDTTVGKAISQYGKNGQIIAYNYYYNIFSSNSDKLFFGDNIFHSDFITIIDRNASNDISTLTFSKISDQSYTGKEIKPSFTVKDGDKTLKKGTDYTVIYEDNTDIGTATITILDDNDYYTGEKEITFDIVPPKTTLSAKKSGGKYALSWKAVKGGITKYQIQYSTDGGKTYKSAGTVSAKKTSTSLKLDTGKSYTLRIRSYKTVDGKKYYSSWSKTVTA